LALSPQKCGSYIEKVWSGKIIAAPGVGSIAHSQKASPLAAIVAPMCKQDVNHQRRIHTLHPTIFATCQDIDLSFMSLISEAIAVM
jgi:hypothetical protein